MTTYAADEDGAVVCVDCLHGACVANGMPCEASECQCECNTERARALDDRPPAALESLARDMEAERRPDPGELTAERFGRPKWGAA